MTAIPQTVRRLGAVSFFNDLASEMVYPLLPALVSRGLGGGAIALGALDGIAEAVSSTVKLFSGYLSDRAGWRRPLVVGGYALAAAARPIIGIAGAVWQVIALRAADRVGKGARTPGRDAMIADVTRPETRGRAFGFHRAMDHAGAVAGPAVAWGMLSLMGLALEQVILWSVLPGILAVALVSVAVRTAPDQTREAGSDNGEETENGPYRYQEEQSSVTGLLFLVIGFAFARFPETLLILRLHDLGLPVALAPAIWAVLHILKTVASYPGGWLADRAGSLTTMAVGWVIYAVACLGLAGAPSTAAGVLWFLSFGLVAPATEPAERKFVAASGSVASRGSKFGIYYSSVGLAALPGGLMFGVIYQSVGGAVALYASAAIALALSAIAVVYGWRVGRR